MVVKSELERLGFNYTRIHLGEVIISEDLNHEQLEQLKAALSESGLELMEDKKAIMNEKIKSAIHELVYSKEEPSKINFSEAISEKLKTDYIYLAGMFSELNDSTIENYYINLKIERVKELLLKTDLTLTEISYELNYCSVAHLSTQFKKNTGLTPTFYKNLRQKKSLPPDNM